MHFISSQWVFFHLGTLSSPNNFPLISVPCSPSSQQMCGNMPMPIPHFLQQPPSPSPSLLLVPKLFITTIKKEQGLCVPNFSTASRLNLFWKHPEVFYLFIKFISHHSSRSSTQCIRHLCFQFSQQPTPGFQVSEKLIFFSCAIHPMLTNRPQRHLAAHEAFSGFPNWNSVACTFRTCLPALQTSNK